MKLRPATMPGAQINNSQPVAAGRRDAHKVPGVRFSKSDQNYVFAFDHELYRPRKREADQEEHSRHESQCWEVLG